MLNILDFGAVGDCTTCNTKALRAAIEACAGCGGGTVLVPAGTFLTGPIELCSNMTLHLDAGAVLLFSGDLDAYPTVRTRNVDGEYHGYAPLLYGRDLSDVAITGRGTIDGQGESWWTFVRESILPNKQADRPVLTGVAPDHPVLVRAQEFAALNEEFVAEEEDYDGWRDFVRPPLIRLMNCRNVVLSGNTHRNSPMWNTHLLYCDNVRVDGVTFLNPPHAPNGDGLDIDSSTNVLVANCFFRVKDDCLCLKSGRNEYGRKQARPTANVTVTNCIMDRGHGAVVMGSETSGDIRNVVISNCLVNNGVPRGIRIKSNRLRGGCVENILANGIIMNGVDFALTINGYYGCGIRPHEAHLVREAAQPVSERTPTMRNVQFSNIMARGVKAAAGYIHGLPEMPIAGVSLSNVSIEMTDDPAEQGMYASAALLNERMAGDGFFLKYARDVSLRDVSITTRQGPSLYARHVEGLTVAGLRTAHPHADTPLVDAEDVTVPRGTGVVA